MTTLYLTLKMTTAQIVEMSVTNNSLSKDYPHPDDHTRQTTDTPGFQPFTNIFDLVKYFKVQKYICFLIMLISCAKICVIFVSKS